MFKNYLKTMSKNTSNLHFDTIFNLLVTVTDSRLSQCPAVFIEMRYTVLQRFPKALRGTKAHFAHDS
jgi:hypothetical protein